MVSFEGWAPGVVVTRREVGTTPPESGQGRVGDTMSWRRAAPEGPDVQVTERRGNRLLEALPEGERERLLPLFDVQECSLKEPLMEAGRPISSVYFPLTAVVSLLTSIENGAWVEIATVGNEGMAGVPVFLGADSLNARDHVQVQVPGRVLCIDAPAFSAEVSAGGAFRRVVEAYILSLMGQVSQQAACNGMHPCRSAAPAGYSSATTGWAATSSPSLGSSSPRC